MQSQQAPKFIWFISPLEEITGPLKFERREELFTSGGTRYEYVSTALPKRKKINKKNHFNDLMNALNKTIKAYYLVNYKNVEKIYIEPFFRAKKSLFILNSDVQKLQNEMPSIFSNEPMIPPVDIVQTSPIQETQQTSITSNDQSNSDELLFPPEAILEFAKNSTNEPQQSHKYQNAICFQFPSEKNDFSFTSPAETFPFKLALNDEVRGLEYEYGKRGSLTNKIHYDLARRFNSFIKGYYLRHYKDEKYLEPFQNRKNRLLISPIDVEKLLNKIPQIFCSYNEEEVNSNQSPEEVQPRVTMDFGTENIQPCISQVDFLNLNPTFGDSTEPKQYKRKLNRVPPNINKADVEMMVQKYQREQEALEELIPQEIINKERIQEILDKENNSITVLAEINQKNIDERLQDFEQQQNLNNNESYSYVQLIKNFPQFATKKRKRHATSAPEPIKKISKTEINQRSEEVIDFIEQSIQLNSPTEGLSVLANSQIQNPYHFFADQPPAQSEIEERDVIKELSEFLQQEESAQQENEFFNFDVNL